MDTQWIAFAVIVVAMIGGAYLMFRNPPKPDPNNKNDRWDEP